MPRSAPRNVETCREHYQGSRPGRVTPLRHHTAAAIELLHNAFLIHDDVEDRSLLRRGQKTIQRQHGVPTAVEFIVKGRKGTFATLPLEIPVQFILRRSAPSTTPAAR